MDKNTIIFYKDWLVSIENLPMDKQASLVFSLLRHVLMGDPAPDDELSKMFYGFVKSQVLRDTEKYNDISKKRAEAGRRHRGNQYTNWNKMEQNGTDGSDNDNDNDNVDDNDNDNDNMPTNVGNIEKTSKEVKKKKAFVKPTVDDVAAYCKERGNYVNPEAFVDFYESKGWKVGSSPMKDWKAAVRTWEKRDGRKPAGINLGVDEWIDQATGERKYGSGKVVPMDAPPRPARDFYWSRASHKWITA